MNDDELKRTLSSKVAAMSMLVAHHRYDADWLQRMTWLLNSAKSAIDLHTSSKAPTIPAPEFLGG